MTTPTFEAISMSPRAGRDASKPAVPGLLLGKAAATGAEPGREMRMEYAVLDLGAEKLVARYVGPAEAMAFNESVLRESLGSLQGQRFTPGELPPPEKLTWSVVSDATGRGVLPVPAGWVVEPGRPSTCRGLPAPRLVVSAFPLHDSTVVLRAAVWPADVAPDTAAASCSARRGSLGAASYGSSVSWLGVPYAIEGTFTRLGAAEVVQLEVLATEPQSAFARALLAIWLKKTVE